MILPTVYRTVIITSTFQDHASYQMKENRSTPSTIYIVYRPISRYRTQLLGSGYTYLSAVVVVVVVVVLSSTN